jgi:aspartyl-tRNA(Asn)/glutamyl-tRNA(Gln) amidotransferase subunit A
LNIAYAMEEKINFKNKINDWWIKWAKVNPTI